MSICLSVCIYVWIQEKKECKERVCVYVHVPVHFETWAVVCAGRPDLHREDDVLDVAHFLLVVPQDFLTLRHELI